MTAYRLSIVAEEQITKILAKSANDYGSARAMNYAILITAAIEDIVSDPRRPGATPVLASSEVWVYELWSSRKRLPRASRVRDPWHKILYRQVADSIEILAVVGRAYPSNRAAREALLE